MREVVRDRYNFIGAGKKERILGGERTVVLVQIRRHVLMAQPLFHFFDRQHVAIAHH